MASIPYSVGGAYLGRPSGLAAVLGPYQGTLIRPYWYALIYPVGIPW